MVVVGGVGVPSHFRVKPKPRLGWVELRLGWGFDNNCSSHLKHILVPVQFCGLCDGFISPQSQHCVIVGSTSLSLCFCSNFIPPIPVYMLAKNFVACVVVVNSILNANLLFMI